MKIIIHFDMRLLRALMTAVVILIAPGPVGAVVLNVLPQDGSSSLRFGRSEFNPTIDKQVRIRISNSENHTYQVFQRILDPLTNERGQILDRSVILAGTLAGSNGSGTLYLQNMERLAVSEGLIYSSDQNGSPDSFTVFYKIDTSQIRDSGNFSGRILYTVRPSGGGQAVEMIMNLFLDASGNFKMSVETSDGSGHLRVRTSSPGTESYIQLNFTGVPSGKMKVYQEMPTLFVDAMNQTLADDIVTFSVLEYPGQQISPPAALAGKRVRIYEADQPAEQLKVVFYLASEESARQKAGIYRGVLRYTVETSEGQEAVMVDMEVEIKPVFNLKVNFPPEGLNFQRLLPNGPLQDKTVELTVNSNLGRPYLINQNVLSSLATERGEQFPQDYFRLRLDRVDGERNPQTIQDFTGINVGDSTVFRSDSQGSPVQLKAIFRISPAADMQPGDYRTMIRFSLEEL